MEFNEYRPNGSWMKYRRRKEMLDKARTSIYLAVVIAAYCIVGALEAGI